MNRKPINKFKLLLCFSKFLEETDELLERGACKNPSLTLELGKICWYALKIETLLKLKKEEGMKELISTLESLITKLYIKGPENEEKDENIKQEFISIVDRNIRDL